MYEETVRKKEPVGENELAVKLYRDERDIWLRFFYHQVYVVYKAKGKEEREGAVLEHLLPVVPAKLKRVRMYTCRWRKVVSFSFSTSSLFFSAKTLVRLKIESKSIINNNNYYIYIYVYIHIIYIID